MACNPLKHRAEWLDRCIRSLCDLSGSLTCSGDRRLQAIVFSKCEMQLSRARFLSSERNDVPRRVLGIRGLEHQIPRSRIRVLIKFEVHRAWFPWRRGSSTRGSKPSLLLFDPNFEPKLYKDDAPIHDVTPQLRMAEGQVSCFKSGE